MQAAEAPLVRPPSVSPGDAPPASRRARRGWIVPVVALIVLASVPGWAGDYVQDLVTRIVVLSVFALSLELLVGTTGLVSLGHAAFFGIGAYVAVLAAPKTGAGFLLGVLLLSMACA